MQEETKKYAKQGEPPVSRDELEKKYTESGIKMLKKYRIIDYIASTEKIKATQKEVDARIQMIADQYGQPFDTIKQTFRKNGTTNRIRDDIREQKTLNFLIGELPAEEPERADHKN